MSFTRREKYAAARAELKRRIEVYPSLVDSGRMTELRASEGIALMQAIMRDYAPPIRGEGR